MATIKGVCLTKEVNRDFRPSVLAQDPVAPYTSRTSRRRKVGAILSISNGPNGPSLSTFPPIVSGFCPLTKILADRWQIKMLYDKATAWLDGFEIDEGDLWSASMVRPDDDDDGPSQDTILLLKYRYQWQRVMKAEAIEG